MRGSVGTEFISQAPLTSYIILSFEFETFLKKGQSNQFDEYFYDTT